MRNLAGAKLQRKVGSGPWTDMRDSAGGSTSACGRARRRSTGSPRPRPPPPPVRIGVVSQPRFTATRTAQALAGVAAPGEAVQVQRLGPDGDWVTVAMALTRPDGTWRAGFQVVPGTYRAYVALGGVVGTSPELTLVAG